MAAVTLNLILLNLYLDPSWSFIKVTAVNMITMGHIGIILSLVYIFTGKVSVSGVAGNMVSFVVDFLGYAFSAFSSEPLSVKLAFGASFALALGAAAATILSMGSAAAIKLVAAAASLIAFGAGIASDWLDTNDIVG